MGHIWETGVGGESTRVTSTPGESFPRALYRTRRIFFHPVQGTSVKKQYTIRPVQSKTRFICIYIMILQFISPLKSMPSVTKNLT